jgi:hypothetical protein
VQSGFVQFAAAVAVCCWLGVDVRCAADSCGSSCFKCRLLQSTLATCLFQVPLVVLSCNEVWLGLQAWEPLMRLTGRTTTKPESGASGASVGIAAMAVHDELQLRQSSMSDVSCCLLNGNSFALS